MSGSAAHRSQLVAMAQAVIDTEIAAIAALSERINDDFIKACDLLQNCQGRVVVTGMGKSGHIGGKIAATLASTGTPAFFVHPGEASHGDLGMITTEDVVIALSNSGETSELVAILPLIKRIGVPLVALTGRRESQLGQLADAVLDVSVEREACPHNLAPTASTTAALVMGDALAVALLEARGFSAEDFAKSHPAGSLGRRLLLHVDDIMHSGEAMPKVRSDATVADALLEMTSKGLGMTAVVDQQGGLFGIFTDGDLRRALDDGELRIRSTAIGDLIRPGCKTLAAGELAAAALKVMQDDKINALLIVNSENKLVGAVNMHDMLRAGVV